MRAYLSSPRRTLSSFTIMKHCNEQTSRHVTSKTITNVVIAVATSTTSSYVALASINDCSGVKEFSVGKLNKSCTERLQSMRELIHNKARNFELFSTSWEFEISSPSNIVPPGSLSFSWDNVILLFDTKLDGLLKFPFGRCSSVERREPPESFSRDWSSFVCKTASNNSWSWKISDLSERFSSIPALAEILCLGKAISQTSLKSGEKEITVVTLNIGTLKPRFS